VLSDSQYYSHKRNRKVPRVTVNETKAAEILGSLYQPPIEPTQDDTPPAKTPKKGKSNVRDKHDVLDAIFAAIERGLPPNGDGVQHYYTVAASSERAAWRISTTGCGSIRW
jgi:hypothetical protein